MLNSGSAGHRFDTCRRVAAITCCVVFLEACGGGSEQTSATDLYGAYDVIEKSMSETQVSAVIGASAQRSQADGGNTRLLTWETDVDNYRHTTLLVTLHNRDGVTRKVVTGYRGNKTQAF